MLTLNEAAPLRNGVKDPQNRQEMIIRYYPLVQFLARKMALKMPNCVDREDVVSFGLLGLIDAIDKYDSTKGIRFESYAAYRIRGEIVDQFRAMDCLPRSARQRVRTLENARDSLGQNLGRYPTDEEVAASLGVSLARVRKAKVDANVGMLSLDETICSGEEGDALTLVDALEDKDAPDPTFRIEQRELLGDLCQAVDQLPERERQLIYLYYRENRSMNIIARRLGVSETRAWQLHHIAIRKLRGYLRDFLEEGAAA